jgi:hypothetical protein
LEILRLSRKDFQCYLVHYAKAKGYGKMVCAIRIMDILNVIFAEIVVTGLVFQIKRGKINQRKSFLTCLLKV